MDLYADTFTLSDKPDQPSNSSTKPTFPPTTRRQHTTPTATPPTSSEWSTFSLPQKKEPDAVPLQPASEWDKWASPQQEHVVEHEQTAGEQQQIEEKYVITEFEDRDHFLQCLKENPGAMIFKFSATWCRPCQKIKGYLEDKFAEMPYNIICGDLDVDDNLDVYAYLKTKKMVNGIPVLLAYFKGNESYIPDLTVTGTDKTQIDALFMKCLSSIKYNGFR